jgi:hypothetical protein
MLKIDTNSDGCVTTVRLGGRIQSDQITGIRSEMASSCPRKILDLSEVTLVDLAVVRFLIGCDESGVELVNCPSYMREWMLRERAEAPPTSSKGT